MDISTIENQIQEYLEKLNKKTLRKVKKGKPPVKVGIPYHLRKFYDEEISKLEKQKEFLLKQKEITKEIEWNDIYFDNYFIYFKINKILSEPYQCLNSRKSLEFLKPYFLKRNFAPISITVIGNKIISIKNLDQIDSIINILTIQDIIRNSYNESSFSNVNEVFNHIQKVTNQNLLYYFNIKDKSKYLEYLCDIQDINYKIIPVTEILFNKDTIFLEEDTFLFTLSTESVIYIVWESTSLNRATYAFLTNEIEYSRDIRNIFGYIISERSRKRSDLKISINTIDNQFNCVGSINHAEFDSWRNKFNDIIGLF